MEQVAGEVADVLVDMAGFLGLARVQFGCAGPGPARMQRSVHDGHAAGGLGGRVGNELVQRLGDDAFQLGDHSGNRGLATKSSSPITSSVMFVRKYMRVAFT